MVQIKESYVRLDFLLTSAPTTPKTKPTVARERWAHSGRRALRRETHGRHMASPWIKLCIPGARDIFFKKNIMLRAKLNCRTCCTCTPFLSPFSFVPAGCGRCARQYDGTQCQWKEKFHWSESEPTHYYCWVELDWPAEEKPRESLSQVVKNSLLFPLHLLWSHQLYYFYVRGARHFRFCSVTAC